MLNLNTLIVSLILATLALPSYSEDAEEVKEAKAATVDHNSDVIAAKERLEAVIIRGEQDYARQAIRSKTEYTNELQKAKRTALLNDNVGNATAITKQIERVSQQIEHLRDVLAGRSRLDPADNKPREAKDPKEAKSKIDKRLVGTWDIRLPRNIDKRGVYRIIEIDSDGVCKIIGGSKNDRKAGDKDGFGDKYQGYVIDGFFVIYDSGWVLDGYSGRYLMLRVNGDNTVTVKFSFRDLTKSKTPNTANFTWEQNYETSRTDSDKEKAKEEEPKEKEQIDFDEEQDDDTADDGEGFFGIPVE